MTLDLGDRRRHVHRRRRSLQSGFERLVRELRRADGAVEAERQRGNEHDGAERHDARRHLRWLGGMVGVRGPSAPDRRHQAARRLDTRANGLLGADDAARPVPLDLGGLRLVEGDVEFTDIDHSRRTRQRPEDREHGCPGQEREDDPEAHHNDRSTILAASRVRPHGP